MRYLNLLVVIVCLGCVEVAPSSPSVTSSAELPTKQTQEVGLSKANPASPKASVTEPTFLVEGILGISAPIAWISSLESAAPVESSSTQNAEFKARLEVQRNTLATLLKSQFVLEAALNQSNVSQLPCVIRQSPNELSWLIENLEIKVDDNTSTVCIQFTCNDAESHEGIVLVDHIIAACINDVVHAERIRVEEELEKANKALRNISEELQKNLSKYTALEKELGEDGVNSSPEMKIFAREIKNLEKFHSNLDYNLRAFQLQQQIRNESVQILQPALARKF